MGNQDSFSPLIGRGSRKITDLLEKNSWALIERGHNTLPIPLQSAALMLILPTDWMGREWDESYRDPEG